MEGMTSKIANATQSELLVITYDLTIDSMEKAKKYLKEENEKEFKRYINKSQSFNRELMNTLNMDYEVSLELMSLYLFVNKCIIKGMVKQEAKYLEDGIKVLNNLKSGWAEISEEKSKDEKPVLENVQRLTVGLTYGRGVLNESMTNNGVNRGFTA